MKKKVKHIAAIRRLLRKAARKSRSFVEASAARAALSAALEGVFTFERAFPGDRPGHGTEVWGTAYALNLGGRKALLVHYGLVSKWGSLDYDHAEEGVALYDPSIGELAVLSYWGQHAGERSFVSDFPSLAKELFAWNGPLGAHSIANLLTREGFGPLGREWAPRVKYPRRPVVRGPRQRRRRRGAA